MMKQHDLFQDEIDKIWGSNQPIDSKIDHLIVLCRNKYTILKQMLAYFFQDEQCSCEQYFYLTFTYHDKVLHIDQKNELALSLLLDEENYFTIEIDVYHYPYQNIIHHTIIEDDKNTTCLLDFFTNEGTILNVEFIKKES